MKKRILAALLAALMLAAVLCGCAAKTPASDNSEGSAAAGSGWPSADTVTLYVPASAGGGTDVSARAIASAISGKTGSSVIVSNLTSGNGTVAYETVRNAKPTGNDLLYFHANFFLNYYNGIYNYAPLDEFTPISLVAFLVEQVIVVKADSPYQTLDDLIKAAAEGNVTAGVQNGGFDDLIVKLLAKDAGVEFKVVEAGSETDRITALLGGNIEMAVLSANLGAQYEETGDMRVLATASTQRDPNYPDYATCAELGYEGTVFAPAFFVFGPKDMDPELVEAMNAQIAATADDSYIQEYLKTSGSTLAMYDVEETNAYMAQLDSAIRTALGK